MAAHAALETQAHDKAQYCDSGKIRPVEPMRLVFDKKTRTKPVDGVQYRVPDQDIAHPVGHHSRHIKNARAEIQYAGQLRPNFVPRFEEGIHNCVDETDPAAEQPYGNDRSGQGWKVSRQYAEPNRTKAGQ